MSLKGFHIVFVTICTLLCIFMALWSLLLSKDTSGVTMVVGSVGVIGALALPVYGICFYRKVTRIHI